MAGNIIGYDINEQYCQISYYNEEKQEPQTLETVSDNDQIPLIVGKKEEEWYIGRDARRLEVLKEGYIADHLYEKAVRRESIKFGKETLDAVWLLHKFVEQSLKQFEQVEEIVFTVPSLNIDIVRMLKGIGQRAGIPRANITVQDYKESFCHYMMYQPKELWQYEAALFHCDRHEVSAYMLRKLRTGFGKGKDSFITVDEVASAQIDELSAVYPVLNVDRARDADMMFKKFIQGVFNKKLISSVFLIGEGFENNWYQQSLKVLCNGRRAFAGNNLYSKGACYAAYGKLTNYKGAPIYLDETKMMEQICLKIRVQGQDKWYPIVSWGTRWYEADMQCEVLLENLEDIEVHIESLTGTQMQVEHISLEGLPNRKNYTLRLQINAMFLDEKTCKITLRDVGFGEFFPPTDFVMEKEIRLGGNNGQFNSLS